MIGNRRSSIVVIAIAMLFALAIGITGCGGGGGTDATTTTVSTTTDGTAAVVDTGVRAYLASQRLSTDRVSAPGVVTANVQGSTPGLDAARPAARQAGRMLTKKDVEDKDIAQCSIHLLGKDEAASEEKGWSDWFDCSDWSSLDKKKVFTLPGEYRVKVRVRGKGCTAGSCIAEGEEKTITVQADDLTPGNQRPTVSAPSCSKTTIKVGEKVECSATTSDPDGDATVYAFDWNDGTVEENLASASSTSHVYSSTGTVVITVFAFDGKDPSNPATATLTIEPAPAAAPKAPTVTTEKPEMVYASTFVAEGTKDVGANVEVNGVQVVAADESATWTYTFKLSDYQNVFSLSSKNSEGTYSSVTPFVLMRNVSPAMIPFINKPDGSVASDTYTITGWKTKDETIKLLDADGNYTIAVASEDSFTEADREDLVQWSYLATIKTGGNFFRFKAKNKAGEEAYNSIQIDKGGTSGIDFSFAQPTLGDKITVTGLMGYSASYSTGSIVLTKRTSGDIYAEFYAGSPPAKGWEQKLSSDTSPAGIRVCGSTLFLSQDNAILTFTISGSTLTAGPSITDSHLAKPMGMTCSSDGTSLYVANNGSGTIAKFLTSTGAFSDIFELSTLKGVVSVTIDQASTILYAITSSSRLVSVNIAGKSVLGEAKWLNGATGAEYYNTTERGFLIIPNTKNYRVELVNVPLFTRVITLGKKGTNKGEFEAPYSVSFNSGSKVLFAIDPSQGTITTYKFQ